MEANIFERSLPKECGTYIEGHHAVYSDQNLPTKKSKETYHVVQGYLKSSNSGSGPLGLHEQDGCSTFKKTHGLAVERFATQAKV